MGSPMQVAAIIMALGILGCFLPLIPGPPIVWLGAVYYAWATHFTEVSPYTLVFLLVLALAGSTADIWMASLGARRTGASTWGTVAGIVGGIVGLILFSVPGLIFGALGAIAIVEYKQHRSWQQILQAGKGYVAGFVLSLVAQLLFCIAIIGIFVLAVRY